MRTIHLIALSAAMVLMSGCYKNWDAIHEGMSRTAVHRELGKPDYNGKSRECWRDQAVSGWSNDHGDYCITFVDGFVDEYGWVSMHEREVDHDNIIIIR